MMDFLFFYLFFFWGGNSEKVLELAGPDLTSIKKLAVRLQKIRDSP